MSPPKGAYLGGIRTLEDIRLRCYVDDFGCWQWRGCITRAGPNGEWQIDGKRQRGSITRAAWFLSGLTVDEGYVVTRDEDACNRSDCCNPSHLRTARRSELRYFRTELSKMRHLAATTVASRAKAKLNPDIVRAIKESTDPSPKEAAKWGVHPTTVQSVRKGKSWRDGVLWR